MKYSAVTHEDVLEYWKSKCTGSLWLPIEPPSLYKKLICASLAVFWTDTPQICALSMSITSTSVCYWNFHSVGKLNPIQELVYGLRLKYETMFEPKACQNGAMHDQTDGLVWRTGTANVFDCKPSTKASCCH